MEPEQVVSLIGQSEGQRIEFKRSFAEENEAIESLCAFANAQGGAVLFGVRDDGQVMSVSLGNRTLTGFTNKLRQNTQPPLAPTMEEVHLREGRIVAVEVTGHQPGQLFHAFGKAFIRVGNSNHIMTPDEMRARLLEANTDWSEERDRPRFEVTIAGASRRETEFTPNFRVRQTSGDPVSSIEWRLRGPRFRVVWRVAQASALERTNFSTPSDLSTPPQDDDRVGANEMGFEIRFHWRGRERHELHRWPLSRREVNVNKVLWDTGEPILPTEEWDASDEAMQGSSTAIHLESLPPTSDNHIQLLLKNDGPPQDFVVDVIGFENTEEPQQQYVMKWRGYAAENRTIYRGRDAVLDVAQVTPPERNPAGIQNAVRRGSFRLFSTSLPTGWDIHAGRSGWIPIDEAARAGNPFDETISLRLRVTGSLGTLITRHVTIGFNRPDMSDSPVWVGVSETLEPRREATSQDSRT